MLYSKPIVHPVAVMVSIMAHLLGQKIAGEGITAALFRQHGIHVVTEQQFLVRIDAGLKLTDEPN